MSPAPAVLLGDPAHFHIRAGANPHTRDPLGRRKQVDRSKAIAQWTDLKLILEHHGVKVHSIPPVEEEPGLVFPANAGFRCGDQFFLSNLNRARAGERDHYRRCISALGLEVKDLPSQYPFEGEADFIPVGDPSGDPEKTVYLFTHGRIERQRWVPRLGIPPYRRVYGFRSDRRVLEALESIVRPREVLPLELIDEAHYHGDTVLCSFGPHRELLLAYLDGLAGEARLALHRWFGDRLIPLSRLDGRRFAANSFQVTPWYQGEPRRVLIMPDGLTDEAYRKVRAREVIPCPVDTSEFLEKGGGAVKCMLLDLTGSPLTGSDPFQGRSPLKWGQTPSGFGTCT
ncbi:MAG: hypothetical protein HYZ93_06890 [Candidatus Omnitrophica bacterium]|nr:hypothetical protein [Candidatus Omnitrophota bacterium]